MSYLESFVNQAHKSLVNDSSEELSIALSYLNKDRSISQESVFLHRIGYWGKDIEIPAEVRFHGDDSMKKDYASFIHGRIIVPVYEEFGDIVGFATRKPTTDPGNSWWNISSPFKKSNHLFILDKTRQEIFKSNKAYIVEGYADAIILHQYGIKNVVCLMGTILSLRKIGLLARYCNNMCFCLDVDKNNSGQKATLKSITMISQFGFCDSISVLSGLPEGEDPDKFIVKNGKEAFLSMEKHLSYSEIKQISRDVKIEKMNGKT